MKELTPQERRILRKLSQIRYKENYKRALIEKLNEIPNFRRLARKLSWKLIKGGKKGGQSYD